MYFYIKNKIASYIDYKIEGISIKLEKSFDNKSSHVELKFEKEIKSLNKYIKVIESRLKDEQVSLLTVDSVWFYTLPKTGSTYLRNVLVNYINVHFNGAIKPVTKDLGKLFHNFHSQNIDSTHFMVGQQEIMKNTDYQLFVHTHKIIKSHAKKNIFILRNPLDYIVSRYFWEYKHSDYDEPLDKVWRSICDEFIDYYHKRIKLSSSCHSLYFTYEDMMLEPECNFEKLICFLGIEFSKTSLSLALELSSKEQVKKEETRTGELFVGNTGRGLELGKLGRDSFIRSGEIGDWQKHLSEELKYDIEHYLIEHKVDISMFTYT
jgi:hypothetical protein